MNNNVICILGPTGAGKTDLACFLSSKIKSEIVSVDSVLVYKGLDIGSAKPSHDTLAKFPHHLVDLIDPAKNYSVGDFYLHVKQAIKEIIDRGNIPILVGGTAMYFHILQNGMYNLPASSPKTRSDLIEKLGIGDSCEALYSHLMRVDAATADTIKPTDKQRIIRALDVFYQSGVSMIKLMSSPHEKLNYNWCNFVLLPPRDDLKVRLKKRLDVMIENGFLSEIECLRNNPNLSLNCSSIKSVGYKQAWEYLDGSYSYDEFVNKVYFSTCQLAKRQYTWFNKWQGHKITGFIGASERRYCLQIALELV